MATVEEIEKQVQEVSEQTQKVVGQVQDKTKAAIAANAEPPTATQIQGAAPLTIPEVAGEQANILNAKSVLEFQKIQAQNQAANAERAATEAASLRETQKEEEQTILQRLTGRGTKAEKREEVFDELGIDKKAFLDKQAADAASIGEIMKGYDAKVASKEKALLGAEQQGFFAGRVRGEKALINKAANIELAQIASEIKTKLAIREMENGNFQQGLSLAREAVEDFVFDLKIEWEQFEAFKEENAAEYDALSQEHKDALQSAQDAKLAELEEKKDNADFNADAMLEYNQFGAGITLGDTREEVIEKITRTQVAQTEGVTDTRRFIQDPDNPNASIPNPNFGQPIAETGVVEEISEFVQFENFVEQNPNASYEEIFAAGQRDSDLTDSELRSILAAAGIEKTQEATREFTDEQVETLSVALVKGFGSFAEDPVGKAKKMVETGQLKIGGKIVELSPEQEEEIKAEIDKQYPSGSRSFFQRFTPKGK